MPSFNGLLSYGIEPLWLIVVLHSMCCEEALFALQQRHFRGICSSSHLHRITKQIRRNGQHPVLAALKKRHSKTQQPLRRQTHSTRP